MSAPAPQPMKTPSVIDQLKRDEGLRLRPYIDTTGNVTIGYGCNLSADGITQEFADLLLVDRLYKAQRALSKALPWTDSLDGPRLGVLQNMAYNMGVLGLLSFKAFLAYMQAGQWEAAARAMLDSLWASQVGERAKRLAEQVLTGQWL